MYVSELRKKALRQFIVAALTTGIAAPKAEVTAEADYDGQTPFGRLFRPARLGRGRHSRAFATTRSRPTSTIASRATARPNTAAMDVVALEPETIANPAEVSDADARGRLRTRSPARTRSSARPRSATSSRSCSPTRPRPTPRRPRSRPARASTTSSRSEASSPKTPTSARRPRTPCSTRPRPTRCSPCPQGGVSGVLKSQFGPVIVRVKGITPSTVKPFAEVAEDIKRQVSASRAGDKIQALHDKIEDLRVSGKSARRGRQGGRPDRRSRFRAVDAQGQDPSGAAVAPAGQGRTSARGLRLRRRARRSADPDQGRRLRLVRRHQGRSVARPDVRGGEARRSRSSGGPSRSTRRSPPRRTISSSSLRAGASVADVAKSVGRRGRSRRATSTATSRRACRKPSSPRSSASRPTARARPRRPTGGRCSRSPPTRRRRSISPIPASRRWPSSSTRRPARACSTNMSRRCAGRSASSVNPDVLQSAEGS